jgi:hypothetical protein
VWYATAFILLAGLIAAPITLTAAARRSHDRAAYLAYEKAVLIPIKDGGRIVQEEMKPSLREISDGSISGDQLAGRAETWRRVFTQIKADVLAPVPPRFLGDIRARWSAAMDAYLAAVDAFAAIARAPAPERSGLVGSAADAGERADKLFDAGARVMQAHRKRLGLGVTADFPD